MADLANTSAIGRLLEEISWEGRQVKQYRQGGRGRENVLTAEVLSPLSFLPREAFLGEVLRKAHGAVERCSAVAAQVENTRITLLPDETWLGAAEIIVQPDATLDAPSTFVLVEAKRIRSSRFQKHQLAREFLAVRQEARPAQHPLLLLILGDPPPVTVSGYSQRIDPYDAIQDGLDKALTDSRSDLAPNDVMATAPESLAWITWAEIQDVVGRQAKDFHNAPDGLAGTVDRLARAAVAAIDWHR